MIKTDKRYSSSQYLADNPSWHIEDSPWKASQILKMVSKHNLATEKVAEVGCGAGEILVELQKRFNHESHLHGYDISPQAIALCRPKSNKQLSFIHGDFSAQSEQQYNLALAIDVFEHIEDIYGFLKKFKEVSDYQIFHIPLDLSVQTLLRVNPLKICNQRLGHLHFYTKDTALMTLKHAGFTVVDHFYTPASIEAPGNESAKSTILKFPRKLLYGCSKDLAVRLLGGYSLLVLTK